MRNNHFDYCFQSKQAQLSYRLYQVQNSKQTIHDCIEDKKIAIGTQKQFNQKIQRVIHSKQSKLQQQQQKCNALDQQIQFYQQYLLNLRKKISELKQKLDEQLKSYLHLTNPSASVKLEHQPHNQLSLKNLIGSKCKFTPHVMNYSWQIEIQKNEEQLQIYKTNDQPSYLFVYNYHPLPSKGVLHFTINLQYSYKPTFLLGVSNCKNKQEGSQHIYLNSETMQIENNGVEVSKIIGQVSSNSKLLVVINCDVWFMFIIVDQVLLCKADLCSIRGSYLYLFVGLSCSDTIIKFDHS